MNTNTKAPSHDPLARMADDVRQLTEPITIPVRQRARGGRTTWTAITHPSLLDQLRAAGPPGGAVQGTGRRSIPASRPPIRVDAVDTLSEIYVALAGWHARLDLPSPPRDADWHKAAMRQLVGAAPTIAPSIADELAEAVYGWWSRAAAATGWRSEDLWTVR